MLDPNVAAGPEGSGSRSARVDTPTRLAVLHLGSGRGS
jgi:hypothetical protein